MLKKIFSFLFLMSMVGCSQQGEVAAAQPLGHSGCSTVALQSPPCRETDSFAVQVFSVLAASQKGNFVFSPASLESVLRLLQQGAGGSTAAELAALPMGKAGVRTAMAPAEAAALFIAENFTLNPRVKVDEVRRVPFATAPDKAAATINGWAEDKTRGLIPTIISARDIVPNTALVAANAIYLKERWLHPFSVNDTADDADFQLENGSIIPVAMMCRKAKYRYAEGEGWRAVAIPYNTEGRQGEPGYFIGILPGKTVGDFARNLTPQQYQDIRRALAESPARDTIVYLPRFELNPGTYSLKPALQACGLQSVFSQGADFSGFSSQHLYLSDVLQRCYCKADEEGTEAAAVTVAVARFKSIARGPRPEVIVFDRPFIWVIGDLNTPAAPYFMGITRQPS